MPSSMIFVSLVVVWLLILVPAVARRRQEVARPSVAALAGRVLDRPRQRQPEVDEVDEAEDAGAGTVEEYEADGEEWADEPAVDDRRWERPPPRYRPGRGGFDPEAAALAARARYAYRQRVVLAMLAVAILTALLAALALPVLWWVHGAADVLLVGYLVYLRRQVRLEEAIRARRAARMAGTRQVASAEDPELDEWARRGREAAMGPAGDDGYDEEYDEDGYRDLDTGDGGADDHGADDDDAGDPAVGASVAARAELPRQRAAQQPAADAEPALPRLAPSPPPPLPAGTALVEADDADPALHELDDSSRPDYRRAAGA